MLIEDIIDQKEISTTRWQSADELYQYLLTKGFKVIGEGAFGYAMSDSTGSMVIKILKTEDTCWRDFIEFASEHHNKHFPIIYDYKEIRNDKNRFVLAYSFIEKLNEFDWRNQDFLFGFTSYVNYIYNDTGAYSKFLSAIQGFANKALWSKRINKQEALAFQQREKSFCDAMQMAKTLFSIRCKGDLRHANIMARNDGTPVIIDPIVHTPLKLFTGRLLPTGTAGEELQKYANKNNLLLSHGKTEIGYFLGYLSVKKPKLDRSNWPTARVSWTSKTDSSIFSGIVSSRKGTWNYLLKQEYGSNKIGFPSPKDIETSGATLKSWLEYDR